ncbi:MAG: hypothetical protein JWM11_4633 [Planctomycetaceae bacterium]|nr:hypothetical protein [Planctomycetaceae bacterium]
MSHNQLHSEPNHDTNSGESVSAELCGFATSLLEQCGGVVDWERPDEAGMAVLPESVARLLGVGEIAPLTTHQEPGAICISLASEFLDLAQVVLESQVARVGAFSIPDHYLKKGDLQEAVDRAFTWHNARVRIRAMGPKEIEYHSWCFFASLKSEDVWESRLNVTINAESLVRVDLPDVLSLPDLKSSSDPAAVNPQRTFEDAVKLLQANVPVAAANFISRMEGRLERDRKRLRDYYGALSREAGSSKRRTATPPNPEEIAARGRAVDLELDRKLFELRDRYQMEASLQPIAFIGLRLNVLAVELIVQRKRAERMIHIYWNPLTKRLEPLRCSHCGQGTYSVAFTDEDVAPLCVNCHHSRGSDNRTVSKAVAVIPGR